MTPDKFRSQVYMFGDAILFNNLIYFQSEVNEGFGEL